jgi:hypothetical protein
MGLDDMGLDMGTTGAEDMNPSREDMSEERPLEMGSGMLDMEASRDLGHGDDMQPSRADVNERGCATSGPRQHPSWSLLLLGLGLFASFVRGVRRRKNTPC